MFARDRLGIINMFQIFVARGGFVERKTLRGLVSDTIMFIFIVFFSLVCCHLVSWLATGYYRVLSEAVFFSVAVLLSLLFLRLFFSMCSHLAHAGIALQHPPTPGMALVTVFMIALGFMFLYMPRVVQATAGINSELSFEGKVVDSSGINIADGIHNMEFKIYSGNSCDPTTGSGCTLDWTEDWLVGGSGGVNFSSGTFQADLGTINAFASSVDWNSYPLYLSLQVGNTTACTITTSFQADCGGDGEMKPYILLTATPYAMNAAELNGHAASDFGQLAQAQTWTAANTVQTTAPAAFEVQNSGGSTTTLAVDTSDGYVGIGTPTPGNKLDIQNSGSGTAVNVAAGVVPTANIVNITNTGQGITANNVNDVGVNFTGGSASSGSEAAGMRIDYTAGAGSNTIWDGLHIVSNPSGPTSGVTSYGVKIDGPTSPGAGTQEGVKITTGFDIGLDIDSGGMQMADMSSTPSAPSTGELKVYAREVDGRSMLATQGPSGVAYALQPSLFQQNVVLVTGGNGAANNTYTTIGSNVTASGTLASQNGSSSEALGNTSRITTGATAGTTAGFYTKNVYYLGSTANGADGFFYFTRMNLNGQNLSNYESGTTGARIFMGLCGATFTNCDASDSPTATNSAGFQLSGSRGDTTFHFMTCNASACNIIDTGVTVNNNVTYDFYAYTPPQGTTVYWRIDDLTDGTAPVEGNSATDLPVGSSAMNAGMSIINLSAANRYLYFQRMYLETDR